MFTLTTSYKRPADHQRFLSQMGVLLAIIFFIKLGGFFTWSENVAITRVVKVFSRLMMTGAIIWVYRKIIERGAIGSFGWQHQLSPFLYAAYLTLGLISFLWSTAVGYSALQWFMDVESFVFAYYFIACFILLENYFPGNQVKLYNVMGNAVLLMISIFLVGMFIAPEAFYRMTHGGEEARLGGFFMNPNELGMLAAVGVSCFIFNYYTGKRMVWNTIRILLLMWAIVMTGSRSTTIGALLIAFFHIRQSSNTKLKYAMYAGAFMVIPLAIEKMVVKENAGGLEEVMSMTGRLPFWTALITEGLPQEPLFGFGFMRIAYKDFFQSVHTYAGQMTHNTFIQVLMNLGFVGFTLVLFQVVFTIRGFVQQFSKEKQLFTIGVFIPILINSLTEFGIFGETNYGILFYQVLIFYISLTINKHKSPAQKIFLRKRRPELFASE
ncbi:O-antigen ligase family protein [Phnomibacter ginsenosidimutans]|uniref:O-antigen ligase domain-containing protein n=1 Tax=Phnomibacter ginsenosidimutans TaxID=2676868 RepID=A0A6I6GPD6_9BACT|nr:O-antigen ligase family protein [Phnomibacter ginsenosidimutans]QGW26949.1 O-antigen ligase domain-containing protein [Phnomibacter ginsenosidimutans]